MRKISKIIAKLMVVLLLLYLVVDISELEVQAAVKISSKCAILYSRKTNSLKSATEKDIMVRDLNGDKCPELLVSGSFDGGKATRRIYTFQKGKVIYMGRVPATSSLYKNRKVKNCYLFEACEYGELPSGKIEKIKQKIGLIKVGKTKIKQTWVASMDLLKNRYVIKGKRVSKKRYFSKEGYAYEIKNNNCLSQYNLYAYAPGGVAKPSFIKKIAC